MEVCAYFQSLQIVLPSFSIPRHKPVVQSTSASILIVNLLELWSKFWTCSNFFKLVLRMCSLMAPVTLEAEVEIMADFTSPLNSVDALHNYHLHQRIECKIKDMRLAELTDRQPSQ